MPGALNSLLRQGPPETAAGGPQPTGALPVTPVPPAPGPAPAAATSAPAPGNPLAALLQQGAVAPGGQAPQRPAPDHNATVAALVHLQAVQKEMDRLSRLPTIGKENIRPEIFDATADLMAKGMFTLPQIMNVIKTIPSDAPGQKQWVMTHLKNAAMAQKAVLSDHAQAFPGSGDFQTEMANIPPADPDQSHTDMMGALAGHYSGRRR